MLRLWLALLMLCLSSPAWAKDVRENLYSYPTAKTIKIGAVFGVLPNVQADDVLLSVSSPVCGHVEIHTMFEDDGIFKMRKIDKLPVKIGQDNRLEPSGYHLMLMDLKSPLEVGQDFPITLTFQKAGDKTTVVPVISRSQK